MAKDDLNFNLDEFLASHSQGTKHMHSPKKKRASQSPSRAAAQQKAAAKKQSDTAVKETIHTAGESEEKTRNSVVNNHAENISAVQESPLSDHIAGANEIIEDNGESTDIFIPAVEVETTQDTQENEISEILSADIADEATHSEGITQSQEQTLQVDEALQSTDIPDEEPSIPAEDFGDKKEIDPEEFFRKEKSYNIPYLESELEQSKSEPLPKYKDRTSEISFAKRRLSDTASVGVRRLKEYEKTNARVYTKPEPEEQHPTEEEILQERLRRDRELTEKILRKAYEQEALNVEFGAESANIENGDNVIEVKEADLPKKKKSTKSKKNKKKQITDEDERVLPVVQVGNEEDNSQSIIDVLENALDEDVNDLEYVSKSHDETHSYETVPEKKKNKAQTFYFFIGLFFTVMSVIGIVVTAKSLVKFVSNVSDDSKQKQEFAEYIYPVVVTDPAAFESVNSLSDEAIIKAALWDIIIYDDAEKYTHDASNNMYVPYIQVENHAKSLFGTTNIVHATVVFSEELTFFYDSESRMYKVPESPQLFPNSPVVREIDKVGERYTLTVDYQEPTPNWELMNTDYTPGIKKTMEYVLTKYNEGYTIISINNVEQSD